jgi:group I intron endonuclease
MHPDRVYVGSSNFIQSRWRTHCRGLKNNVHHNYKLQRHYNKYGLNNFIFEIIETCSQNEFEDREQYYMGIYKYKETDKPWFNIDPFAIRGKGRKLSQKHINLIKERTKKPVLQFSTTGFFIREWASVVDINHELGYDKSAIYTVLFTKNRRPICGYLWVYKKDYNGEKMFCRDIKNKHSICQYSLDGIFIQSWESIAAAAKFYNKSESCISNACSGRKKSIAGFLWRFQEDASLFITPPNIQRPTKIYQYTLDGSFIKEWESADAAARELHFYATHMRRNAQGVFKQYNGFVWSYQQPQATP